MKSGVVLEPLGRGLRAILAPKGAPGTKSFEKGNSSIPLRGPSWRPKSAFFRFGCSCFGTYFSRGVWEGFQDNFWIDFGWFFGYFFDDFFGYF